MYYFYRVKNELGWAFAAFFVGLATEFLVHQGEVFNAETLIPALVFAGFRAVAAALIAKAGPGTIKAS